MEMYQAPEFVRIPFDQRYSMQGYQQPTNSIYGTAVGVGDPRGLLTGTISQAMSQRAPRPVEMATVPNPYTNANWKQKPQILSPAVSGPAMPTVLPQAKPQRPSANRFAPQAMASAARAKGMMPTGANATATAPSGMSGKIAGLLGNDLSDPRAMGLLSASAALLEAGGPQTGGPVSLGQALGRGMSAGVNTFQAAKDNQINQRYKSAQAKQMEANANKPILTDLGGGAYTRVTDPITGESEIVENSAVKEYLAQIEKDKAASKSVNVNLGAKGAESEADDLMNIDSSKYLIDDANRFIDMIDAGELEFGVIDSLGDSATLSGLNPFANDADRIEAQNSQSFQRYINRMRNELLRMAKGVQTEGDAQRVIDELVTSVESRDNNAVKQALVELREVQERTVKLTRDKVNNRRKAQGIDAYEFGADANSISYETVGEG